MMKKLLFAAAALLQLAACTEQTDENTQNTQTRYTARMEVAAQQQTRAYDSDLNWYWTEEDAIAGYQCAGLRLRNQLRYIETAQGFVCEAFEYMSTSPEKFHFIYPAEAEVSEGVLRAAQNGSWQPLSVATVEDAVIENIPMVKFSVLSAALELRVFEADKATPRTMTAAKLTAEEDFVGKWTLQEDMTYVQSLDGTEMVAEGFSSEVVTLNMPDAPEGFAAEFFTLMLTDAEGQTMTRTLPAMTFVKGKRTVLNLVFVADNSEGGEGGGNEGGEDPDQPVTPEPEEPETITGTFTCATYNVDGLPSIINSDGPGDDGTTNIGNKVATTGWDIVTFQENFAYSSSLKTPLSSVYKLGTDRGNINYGSAIIGRVTDTDGLLFGTLKETCSFSGESWEAFNDAYGGLTDGANTLLKKGIRHYVVTMKDGVEIDLLVTHMNSGSDSGHISARASQLAQIAAYINKISANNRPIIFMGDTNCRYTRDDMFQYLFNKLDSDLTYADPWVEYSWNGVYPTLGSASLMVPSKDSSSTLTEQTGEVVDKIIYFNNPNADTQIKANNYLHDESYTFADHKPVVSEFTYVKTIQK